MLEDGEFHLKSRFLEFCHKVEENFKVFLFEFEFFLHVEQVLRDPLGNVSKFIDVTNKSFPVLYSWREDS